MFNVKVNFWKTILVLILTSILFNPLSCGTDISTENGKLWHNIKRSIRYHPEDGDFVIVNGTHRFNRALYGSNTGFRVEAGDLPEFALYMPGMGGNLKFGLVSEQSSKWLIKADYIKTRYRAGSMIYEILDNIIGNGRIILTVIPLFNGEGVITRFEFENIPKSVELIWAFGGATGKRFNRDGDIGADPESVFYLHPEYCSDNVYELRDDSFTLHYGIGRVLTENEIYENNYKPSQAELKSTQIKVKKRLVGTLPVNSEFHIADATKQTNPVELFKSVESQTPVITGKQNIQADKPFYFCLTNPESIDSPNYSSIPQFFEEAEMARQTQAAKVKLETPDEYLNTLGAALCMAADAVWEHPTYLHGAIAWRMRLPGWRGAYTADALGWHDLAQTHFSAYAKAQYIKPKVRSNSPDPKRNLARQREEFGKAIFTSGYISRHPGKVSKPHHYDMNLVFIDQLLRHFFFTGDLEYLAEMWPVIERHLEWEKRSFDPDGDGLYDAYASFWASDAIQYSGGGVTHSSSYNYYANKMAAYLAPFINKDPKPYKNEARRILTAINNTLWMPEKGWYAEYKDMLGNKLLHESPAVWTIYHALDSDVPDPFQAYQSLRYIDNYIPHIPIKADGLSDDDLFLVSTTNWMPYTWSVNNVAFAEVMHTALAYWQAGRNEKAFTLWKSMLMESMYLTASPGNFQQLSFYDAFRGELYRDFSDPVAMAARTLVEGIFDIFPNLLEEKLVIQPGFPEEWDHASLKISDISIQFKRTKNSETYTIKPSYGRELQLILKLPALRINIEDVLVNGSSVSWNPIHKKVGRPWIEIDCGIQETYSIDVKWSGDVPEQVAFENYTATNEKLTFSTTNAQITDIYDPQGVWQEPIVEDQNLVTIIKSGPGFKTAFVHLKQGAMEWWEPVDMEIRNPVEIIAEEHQDADGLKFRIQNNTSQLLVGKLILNSGAHGLSQKLSVKPNAETDEIHVNAEFLVPGSNRVKIESNINSYEKSIINWHIKNSDYITWDMVTFNNQMNDKVTNIFKPQYVSPRSPYPTLQIPIQGIGDWCSYGKSAHIDDSGLRVLAGNSNQITIPQGIPFKTPNVFGVNNILFTSLWDNYPEKATISLTGKASHIYLLMAGSTNHMQCRFVNGVITVEYADGSSEQLELINPETWWPIEQDYYEDGYAFVVYAPRPPRIHLKNGETDMTGYNVLARNKTILIDGGAATVLDLPLDPAKELKTLCLKTTANEVVIGLMGITLMR